jgi:quercetin dioxygenase-like cupin family protein
MTIKTNVGKIAATSTPLAAILALYGVRTPAESARPAPAAVIRTELAHSDVPGTDLEIRLYLITYPPGAAAPLHHHPVEGLGYILEGEARSAYGPNPPVTLTEGQSFVDIAGAPHTLFENTDRHWPLRFVIAYTVKKGAPVIETP